MGELLPFQTLGMDLLLYPTVVPATPDLDEQCSAAASESSAHPP